MINTNSTSRKQIDLLKIIIFLRTFILLAIVFLIIKNQIIINNWLWIAFISLASVILVTQIFCAVSISNCYIDRKK